jgi:CTP:molybdopterin cytidylyltransferase MocA
MMSCILLAAGSSKRFGSSKALAELDGTPVIERIQQTLIASSVGEIIVVLGDHVEAIKPHLLKHNKIKFVHNKDYNLGQTSSFKVGLEALNKDSQGIMLWPVDCPLMKVQTINLLVSTFFSQKPRILIPTFQKIKGHPPVFDAGLKRAFLKLDHSVGINTVEHEHASEIVLFPVDDPGVVQSFNTPEEFIRLKKSL